MAHKHNSRNGFTHASSLRGDKTYARVQQGHTLQPQVSPVMKKQPLYHTTPYFRLHHLHQNHNLVISNCESPLVFSSRLPCIRICTLHQQISSHTFFLGALPSDIRSAPPLLPRLLPQMEAPSSARSFAAEDGANVPDVDGAMKPSAWSTVPIAQAAKVTLAVILFMRGFQRVRQRQNG